MQYTYFISFYYSKKVDIPKGDCDDMVKIAEKLSEGFPYARVDLYNIRGRIVFGEITFYPWSGYVKFTPDAFDFELGGYFTEY